MGDHSGTPNDMNRGMQTRRYIKPTICNRDFLTTRSLNSRQEKEWGFHLAKATGVDVSTIVELNLEFCNIQSTYGLGYLRSCQKLKLNNNIISRIIGLDDLSALRILDLSFNSIERIEGLHKCLKLEELLLFHNTIAKVEGVATLKNLILVNLGCNQIRALVEVHAFRHLPKLRPLNLERNPVTKLPNYREYVVVWISQLRYLDWKRIQAPLRASATEIFKDDYRAFVHKEKSEEKKSRIRTEANLDMKGSANQESVLPPEYDGDLFAYLNDPEEELEFITSQSPDGPSLYESYRQRIAESGNQMNSKYSDILFPINRLGERFESGAARMIDNYATCGKLLVEGVVTKKYRHLEAIKEELDGPYKKNLREYCHILDDVSHDLVKLLMQLQLKLENMVAVDVERIKYRLSRESAWIKKEVDVLIEFERQVGEMVQNSLENGDRGSRPLTEEEMGDLHSKFSFHEEDETVREGEWMDRLREVPMMDIVDQLVSLKQEKLSSLAVIFQESLESKLRKQLDLLEDRQEAIYHQRLQEILDFIEQHKAEAFLTRKRALMRHGRQDLDDDVIQPEVQNIMNRKTKPGTQGSLSPGRPVQQSGLAKKVEFESDEPLADYIVMKDIKDIVDQISDIPLAERKRLFETRIVEVDDIADHIHVKDEVDQEVFAKNLAQREETTK